MALKSISDHCSLDASYQNTAGTSDRSVISSFIHFLQKHHLDETQTTLLRELALTEKSPVTLDEIEHAIFKRDSKFSKDSRSLHNGHFFPFQMETAESGKYARIMHPETFVLLSDENPLSSESNEISMPSPMRNCPNTPHSPVQDLVYSTKIESPSIQESEPMSTAISTPYPSTISTAHNYQVPIILNSLASSNPPNNVVTLLQSHQGIPNSIPQQTQILLDVGSNSIGQISAANLNSVIPIHLNLPPAQSVQPPQQVQLINSSSKPFLQRPTQTQIPIPGNSVPILLSRNGESPSSLVSVVNCPPKGVPRILDTTPIGQNGTSPITFQVQYQQPIISTQTKSPVVTPVIQQTRMEQEPQLISKEGAQITLDQNSHPILSYSQFPSTVAHSPKTVITSNGICQNLQITGNTWVKDASGDVHIPILNTTPLGTHYSLDPAFELGQRRRKKRAVFAPQVRRALEQSFEQNSRPSRRDLEYLAGKLGLLFEEVRVWFCNKRQKERQQVQMSNEESQCDTPDCVSPPHYQSGENMEETGKVGGFLIKQECELPNKLVLVPGVSDFSPPLPKEILMPDSYEPEYRTCSSEPTITASIA